MKNLKGIFFAATFFVLLPEVLRIVGMPSFIAANMRQIIYGLALILVIYRMGKQRSVPSVSKFQ